MRRSPSSTRPAWRFRISRSRWPRSSASTSSRACPSSSCRPSDGLGHQQALRVEEVEERRLSAEDRLGDELATDEAEHVAVARVPARDPDTILAGDATDDGQEVEHKAEDAGPAVRDA